jgi:TRAP-type C4-dicarboxylate transport system permease large subunit
MDDLVTLVFSWAGIAAIISTLIPPIVFFILYAVRQDRFSLRALMAFVTVEAIALAAATCMAKYVVVVREYPKYDTTYPPILLRREWRVG